MKIYITSENLKHKEALIDFVEDFLIGAGNYEFEILADDFCWIDGCDDEIFATMLLSNINSYLQDLNLLLVDSTQE